MDIEVDGKNTFAATGGKDFDAAKPSIVFVHGGGLDHTTWVLQTRYFSYHGYNVLAVDMPGHGRSEGPVPATVEDTADWIIRLIDALELDQAAQVGDSTGSLVTFDAAARHKDLADLNSISDRLHGYGGSFGFPLVITVSRSLHQLTSQVHEVDADYLELVRAHLDTLQAVLKVGLNSDGGEVGRKLVHELYRANRKFVRRSADRRVAGSG